MWNMNKYMMNRKVIGFCDVNLIELVQEHSETATKGAFMIVTLDLGASHS
jgi:hypothetical protein